jgi:HAD superfamily hydrolase (TIGR01509 family)
MRAASDPHRKFDCLIFDLFGVVISFDEEIVYQRLARHCADPAQALPALRGLVSQDALIRGRLTLQQLHQRLVADHGLSLDTRGFEAAWLAPYSAPMPGMADLLRRLSKSYVLLLLSNVDKHYWAGVRDSHPELGCFNAFLLSWELGAAKPEAEVFLRSIEVARSCAARCFFIDDKRENVKAAQALGLSGHTFVGIEDLLGVFEREGIDPCPSTSTT